MEEMKWLTGRWVPAPCVSLKSSIRGLDVDGGGGGLLQAYWVDEGVVVINRGVERKHA